MLDTGGLNPVVSVQRVEGCGRRLVVESSSEDDGGPFGTVREVESMGAVGVTGAGGAAREVEEGFEDEADVGVDSSDEAGEVIGGAPDTAEVLDGDWDADVLELKGIGAVEELNEVVEVAAVAQDGGVCGASNGVLVVVVVVSEEDEEDEEEVSGVPSGLSGSLVTVTQSVMDTVLLLTRAIGCASGQSLVL